MLLSRRAALGATAGLAVPLVLPARAQTEPTIRIGVLADFSGPYRDTSGPTSVACVHQAIEDLGLAQRGIKVEVLQGDHQNKPDIGMAITREWFDRRDVDMVCEVNNSAVALALAGLAKDKDKIQLTSGAVSSALTGESCSSNTIQWTYDTWMLAHSTAVSTVRTGHDSWYFVTADYSFGTQMERDTTHFITQAGGRVLGSARFPFPGTTDFSSFLLQAQASRAKVIGLGTAGADTVNCIKQASEFGLTASGMKLAGLVMFITDVHSMGLETAQGLLLTEVFYWNLNERTRAFMNRIRPKVPANWPNQEHAGTYSAAYHYLKTVTDMGVAQAKLSGRATIARMKAMPTDDDCLGAGRIREDGRKIHAAYLLEVKKPSESSGPWDYYKLAGTTPAEEAFRPLAGGNCPLVRG